MCPIAVRTNTQLNRMNTVPCADQAAFFVEQMMLPHLPHRGVKGALELIRRETNVSFWKLRKLYNPNLRKYGLALLADEMRAIEAAYDKWLLTQERRLKQEQIDLAEMKARRLNRRLDFGDPSNSARPMAAAVDVDRKTD